MIAINSELPVDEPKWQPIFVAMLREIEQKLRLAFCRLDPETCEDRLQRSTSNNACSESSFCASRSLPIGIRN
jgi:hypothetical protein